MVFKGDLNAELEKLKYKIKMIPKLPENKHIIYAIFAKEFKGNISCETCNCLDAEMVMDSLKF